MNCIRYLTADVDGVRVFYREAGSRDVPALLRNATIMMATGLSAYECVVFRA